MALSAWITTAFAAAHDQARAVYRLNLRTFLRAILQYTDVTRDPDLYLGPVPEQSRCLFSQYLFSYKLNPQTVLFIGYRRLPVGAHTPLDLTQSNRAFFAKIGYAWLP